MPRKPHGEHENFLEVLQKNGGTMDLWSLNGLMLGRNTLGFGVTTMSVAYALQWEGKVVLRYSDERSSGDPDEVLITESRTKLLRDLQLI